jgi:hypothetical protein
MSGPLDAAWEIGDFLKHHDISCVVIGGLAVQIWGDARLTIDADVTISSSLEEGTAPLVKLITKHLYITCLGYRMRMDDWKTCNHLYLSTMASISSNCFSISATSFS